MLLSPSMPTHANWVGSRWRKCREENRWRMLERKVQCRTRDFEKSGVQRRASNKMSNNSHVSMTFSSVWYKNRPTVLQGWLVKLRVSIVPFPILLSSHNVCTHSASPSTRHSITDAPVASRV